MNRRGRCGALGLALSLLVVACPVVVAPPGAWGADSLLPRMVKYEIRYYVIHSDLDANAVREAAVRMNTMAEEYHRRTKGFAGTIRKKLPFYLFKEPDDYAAAGGLEGSAGVFIVRGGKAWLMAIATAGGGRLWRVVQHEGFHQFAWFVISHNLPVWVNEGLAEYFAHGEWTGDGYVTGLIPPYRLKRVKAMIEAKKYMPFLDMVTMSSKQWNAELSARNYLQGWSMVHFLVHADDGKYRKTFGKYITDVSRGRDAQLAFIRRFGTNTKAFRETYCRWWAALPKSPTPDGYTEATVATLTSFLARTRAARVEAKTVDEFFAAARAGKIKIDGKKLPKLWLPQSLLKKALKSARRLGAWSFETGVTRSKLVLTQIDGTTFTGSYVPRSGKAPKVKVKIVKPKGKPAPKPKAASTTKTAPAGKR